VGGRILADGDYGSGIIVRLTASSTLG